MNSLLHTFFLAILLAFLLASCADKYVSSAENTSLENSNWLGTQYYRWTDTSRPDYIYEKGAFREVLVQVWYPIAPPQQIEEKQKAPYFPFLEEAKSVLPHWTQEDFEEVNRFSTQSLFGVKIHQQKEKYPLIVLSPALGSHSSYYTMYAERFAEQGYVVLGVNSKYESEYVVNETGVATGLNHQYHDSLKALEIPAQITADEYRAARSKRLIVIAEDLLFAINQLEKSNKNTYNGMIDFENIGIIGHSIGGCAAIDAARMDKRVKAAVNLDGTPSSQALAEGMDQPFMFIEDLTDYKNHTGYKKQFDRRENFCKKVKSNAYRVLIANTNHSGFYSSNLRFAHTESEKAEAARPINISYQYSADFFSRYLKNKPVDFVSISTENLEVFTFEK